MIKIPQYTLANIVKNLLLFTKANYEAHQLSSTPEQSFLYTAFYEAGTWNRINIYDEAVSLFTKPKGDPRFFDVRLGFDEARAKEPTAHVLLGSENEFFQGVGLQSSWMSGDVPGKSKERWYDVTLSIVFTSSNQTEVILMYEITKAFITQFADAIELLLNGIGEIRISGQDLTMTQEEVPPTFFSRLMSIKGKMTQEISLFKNEDFTDIANFVFEANITE